MGTHDRGYKLLFSNKEMMRDLLLEFVTEEWVDGLDLDTLDRVHDSFVTDDLRERFDDIIWRVSFRGRMVYLCLIVEFQSSPDRWIAGRLMAYIGLLYGDIVKRNEIVDGFFPPVLPIVLYSGEGRWTVPLSLEEMLHPASSVLGRYAPHLRYLLLDESAYSEERLAQSKNLAAFLFRMENSRTPDHLLEIVRSLGGVLDGEEHRHLRRSFAVFVRNALLPKKTRRRNFPDVEDLVEVERMIAEGTRNWADGWIKEGEERGEKRGEERGEKRGEERGEKRGEQRGRERTALRMLEHGMDVALIAKLAELSEERVRRLAAQSSSQ